MPGMPRFDVCVHGSGIVGLAAALALSRLGMQVAVTAPPPRDAARSDLRAYALNLASVKLLGALKVWDALPADARTLVADMHVVGDDGRSTLDFSAWSQGIEQLAWIVDAAELESCLATAVAFAPHVHRLDAGIGVDAALQVHAEGRGSEARQQLGVSMALQSYGQRAVAARLVADQAHGALARQWFRSPQVLALLPFDRPEAGRSYALVWSLPEAEAEMVMSQPPAEFESALAAATGEAAGRLRLASERAAWPLAVGRASAVCGPGWVLVGDAAHVVHPLAGQGLNLGLADVAALADELGRRERWRPPGDERLLRRYARRREADTWAMAQLTDGLWHLFASPNALAKELRNRGLTLVNELVPLKRLLTARASGA